MKLKVGTRVTARGFTRAWQGTIEVIDSGLYYPYGVRIVGENALIYFTHSELSEPISCGALR